MNIYIHILIYIHACMHACMQTYIHTYIRTCMHACIHTYIHIYIYTHIHIYIYIYIFQVSHFSIYFGLAIIQVLWNSKICSGLDLTNSNVNPMCWFIHHSADNLVLSTGAWMAWNGLEWIVYLYPHNISNIPGKFSLPALISSKSHLGDSKAHDLRTTLIHRIPIHILYFAS